MIGQLLTGRYLILKKLGSGGFSDTYLARDKYLPHHPLCVVKCLKLPSNNTISPETAQRLFETEARVLDQLGQHHAQIPTLFAYCQEQEQTYLVQEYIEGENLGNWIAKGRRLTSESAIELLWQMLPVLDYIHSHHVIHRDIKPSNLIRRNQDGQIILLDFGAACLVSPTSSSNELNGNEIGGNELGGEDVLLSIGTPGYMPNEQEAGASRFSSDLYALGVSVIHLLTGIHPQEFQSDPISGELNWHVHLRQHALDPNFIAILDRMVRNRSRDRYQCASDVIAALFPLMNTNTLKGWSSLQSWAAPNWRRSLRQFAKPIAATAVFASVLGGWYVYDHQLRTMVAEMLPSQPNMHLTLLRDLPVTSDVDQMMIAPNNRILITAESDHVLRLWSVSDGSVINTLSGHTDTVTALAMSRTGNLLVSGGDDRTVRLWDVDSGALLLTLEGHQDTITSVAMSADAQTVVSGSKDGTIRLWDLQTGMILRTFTLDDVEITAVAYGTQSSDLISASSDRQLQVWDLKTGKLQRTFAGHTARIEHLHVMDDNRLFSFGDDRTLEWDLEREELVQVFSTDSANPITATLNDRQMITVHDNGSIRVWTRQAGDLVSTLSNELGRNVNVAFSPDHHYLVSWSPTERLRIWQVNTTTSKRI